MVKGNKWIAVRDRFNEWIQIGDNGGKKMQVLCVYDKPSGGQDLIHEVIMRITEICDSVTEADIGSGFPGSHSGRVAGFMYLVKNFGVKSAQMFSDGKIMLIV